MHAAAVETAPIQVNPRNGVSKPEMTGASLHKEAGATLLRLLELEAWLSLSEREWLKEALGAESPSIRQSEKAKRLIAA